MNEPTITAEDLTLYALQLLEGEDEAQVQLLLRSSSEAREELGRIHGDLALFAMGTEAHAPNPLTRQRLLKAVARERRSSPVAMPSVAEAKPKHTAPVYVADSEPEEATAEITPASWAQIRDALTRDRSFEREDNQSNTPLPRLAETPQVRSADALDEVPSVQRQSTALPVRPAYSPVVSIDSVAPLADEDKMQDRYVPSNFAFTSFESSDEEKSSRGVNRWFAWAGWALAAGLATAGAFALRENFGLRRQIAFELDRAVQAEAGSARAQQVLQTLQSGASQRFVLARTDAVPVPTGRVAYLPERGTLVFQGSNLEPLAPYKTYELWLLPAGEGQQPVPAGTFKPDVRGYASVLLPQMPKGIMASNFGVTVEDEGGASAPTLPILLMGQQS